MLNKLLPVFTTALFYGIYYLISASRFDVQIALRAIPFDYLLQLVLGYLLYMMSRKAWTFVLIQGLLMGILYVGNAVKISFFGGPIMPDDIYALRSLLLILEGWQFFAVAVPLAALISLFLFNIRLRHPASYLSCLALVVLDLTLLYQPTAILEPLDRRFGNSVWDQHSNYLWRGATHYTLQEGARFFAAAEPPPDLDTAKAHASALLAKDNVHLPAAKPFKPRNVHVILLESLWDPNALKQAGYNENPLAPEFRRLWKSSGYATALSPVFGGYTANSEFEVLCGFPVVKDSVKFERQLLNDVPCLPHILGKRGYRTLASHPNVPVFWNRINAYRLIGFQTYWSKGDFLLDDMNREFLSDSSLYRQVLEKISGQLESKQPIFNYILTYFGHWNYPLSESRPSRITSKSTVEEVTTYANMIYYKSRELMVFLEALHKRDPEAIIVLFGDHLPYMGENFSGYVDSKILVSKRSDFTPEMYRTYVSTPLIVIDGQRGALKLGALPVYEIPKLLLTLLNYDERTIMDYTVNPPGMRIRPLPGLHVNLLDGGKVVVCKDPPHTGSCEISARWLSDVNVVGNDLFTGKQFTWESLALEPEGQVGQ